MPCVAEHREGPPLGTLACAVLAVLAHFLFEAPAAVRSFAEGEIEDAVRSAVREEVRNAATEQGAGR